MSKRKTNKEEIQPWLYQDKPVEDDIYKNYEGFVYILTYTPTNQKYIGKKSFWSNRKLKPTDKKKSTVESDWKTYFSSSDDIKDLVKGQKHLWKREIIYLCEKMKYANYLEVKLQFAYGVLESDEWLNSNINGLWFSHWLRNINEEVKDCSGDE